MNLLDVNHMALDWISGNWYFITLESHLIYVCTSEMRHCKIILEKNVNHPHKMALDPTKG